MISETITIPKTISDGEDRFVLKLKENLLRIIKEINKNGKKIDEINTEHKDPDYTDEFNKKANIDASNIGYGELFKEKKNNQGEVVYSDEDNRKEWGMALTNVNNLIESDNLTLVSSQNVYDETHPYMEKDGEGNWINPYYCINYKNLTKHEGAEDINKQDRWSEQDIFEPHEPNDNKVKENLIALDTAIYEVAQQLDGKANISLDNLNQTGYLVINGIGMGSTYVRDWRALGVQDPLVKVDAEMVQDPETGLYTNVYTVYSDYEPSGGQQDLSHLARRDAANVAMNRVNAPYSDTYEQRTQARHDWASALGLMEMNEEVDKDGSILHTYMDAGYNTITTDTNKYGLIDSRTFAKGVVLDNSDQDYTSPYYGDGSYASTAITNMALKLHAVDMLVTGDIDEDDLYIADYDIYDEFIDTVGTGGTVYSYIEMASKVKQHEDTDIPNMKDDITNIQGQFDEDEQGTLANRVYVLEQIIQNLTSNNSNP